MNRSVSRGNRRRIRTVISVLYAMSVELHPLLSQMMTKKEAIITSRPVRAQSCLHNPQVSIFIVMALGKLSNTLKNIKANENFQFPHMEKYKNS